MFRKESFLEVCKVYKVRDTGAMDNLEYLCDHRAKQDRQSLIKLLMKHSELLSLNCEILAETGSDEDIEKLVSLLRGLNYRYE